MSLQRTFLKNASARTANTVGTTAFAEGGVANWTAGGGATALPAQTAVGGSVNTPFAWDTGANDSAWAKSVLIGPGASGGGLHPTAYYVIDPAAGGAALTVTSTNGHKVSLFVRRPAADPATTFTFQFHNDNTGGGTAGDHSVLMSWDAGSDSWKMTQAEFGAVGMECPEKYADGWHRLEFFYQRRQHGTNLEAAVAANVLTFRISCTASLKLHVWGVLYEIPTATTILVPTEQAVAITDVAGTDTFGSTTLTIDEGTVVTFTNSTGSNAVISSTGNADSLFAFTSPTVANAGTFSNLFLQAGTYTVVTDNGGTMIVYVRKTATMQAPVLDMLSKSPAAPYLDGIVGATWPYGVGGPWTYRPGLTTNSRNGLFQCSMQSTPTASMVMLGRTGPNSPYELIQTTTQADVDSNTGAEVDAVALYPEMRFAITVWTAGTLGAWLSE